MNENTKGDPCPHLRQVTHETNGFDPVGSFHGSGSCPTIRHQKVELFFIPKASYPNVDVIVADQTCQEVTHWWEAVLPAGLVMGPDCLEALFYKAES